MVCKSKTFNVGDKVRILDVDAIFCGANSWANGDVREVLTISDNGNPRLSRYAGDTHGLVVHEQEFHAIERISPLSKKRRIEALEKDVARQETELEELRAKIEAFEQKAKSADWLSDAMRKVTKETSDTISKALLEVTPSQRRAQIIADAKKFVEQTIEDARDEDGGIIVPVPLSVFTSWICCEIKFEVNAEKRTVVALAIGICDGKVVEKAIAKCAPDDVFNADIGKAIAVGRLFGLDVERFVYAPKPDEFVVGHVISVKSSVPGEGVYLIGKVKQLRPLGRIVFDAEHTEVLTNGYCDLRYGVGVPNGSKIIDDTEAQYE